jgi:pimeloyl-ACP methyl ester carboxylesterase
MQGLADEMTSPAGAVELYRSLQHGRLELIERAGHNVHIELGESFRERIDRFLQPAERVILSRRA